MTGYPSLTGISRRNLLSLIGLTAGSAVMYQAMTSLGFAAESGFKGPVKLEGDPKGATDLNPIEQAFAKIKHWMRAAQKRTVDETWRHLGYLVSTIEPHECANYFVNAGYASVKT